MVNTDVVAFNIAAFIATLFLLEFGADKFIDHTAIVARRARIPDTLIGLLTVGGEWEELAIIIASLARNRASLAIGNVVGAAIANIIGAFSLSLLFQERGKEIQFDKSSRIYSLLLLVLTTFVAPIIYFPKKTIWLSCGTILIVLFTLYVGSVGWAISKRTLTAPEGSDSDSSDEEDNQSGNNVERTGRVSGNQLFISPTNAPPNADVPQGISPQLASEPPPHSPRRHPHTLNYHIFHLIFGSLAIGLSGYVLSHAATNIIDEFRISEVLFGVVILSIATTLPEKFIAVLSGRRGRFGIIVAATAGSNIFLLSLCSGIVMLQSSERFEQRTANVAIPEIGVLWGSTLAFTLTIWFGGKLARWIGVVMLLGYVAFIVLEFTIIHRVNTDI